MSHIHEWFVYEWSDNGIETVVCEGCGLKLWCGDMLRRLNQLEQDKAELMQALSEQIVR